MGTAAGTQRAEPNYDDEVAPWDRIQHGRAVQGDESDPRTKGRPARCTCCPRDAAFWPPNRSSTYVTEADAELRNCVGKAPCRANAVLVTEAFLRWRREGWKSCPHLGTCTWDSLPAFAAAGLGRDHIVAAFGKLSGSGSNWSWLCLGCGSTFSKEPLAADRVYPEQHYADGCPGWSVDDLDPTRERDAMAAAAALAAAARDLDVRVTPPPAPLWVDGTRLQLHCGMCARDIPDWEAAGTAWEPLYNEGLDRIGAGWRPRIGAKAVGHASKALSQRFEAFKRSADRALGGGNRRRLDSAASNASSSFSLTGDGEETDEEEGGEEEEGGVRGGGEVGENEGRNVQRGRVAGRVAGGGECWSEDDGESKEAQELASQRSSIANSLSMYPKGPRHAASPSTQQQSLQASATRTGLVYDKRMCDHADVPGCEIADRVRRMWAILTEEALAEQCVLVPAREATDDELLLVHTREHVRMVDTLELMTEQQCKVTVTVTGYGVTGLRGYRVTGLGLPSYGLRLQRAGGARR